MFCFVFCMVQQFIIFSTLIKSQIFVLFNILPSPIGSIIVPYPGRGVCADPRSGDATSGVGGPRPPTTDNEHRLSPDRGGEKM
jgi:hypothetical protein